MKTTGGSRKPISKKVRFEIFKRDAFTCQYCGRRAPEVLLVVDHVEPVSAGGSDDIFNLVTSCGDCNAGKSDRRLSDTKVLDRQHRQLEDLQERQEQIEMMFQWQKGLHGLDDQVIDRLSSYWSEQVLGYSLNDNGLRTVKRLKRKYEIDEIMAAMRIAAEQYVQYHNGVPAEDSVQRAWGKVGGICRVKRQEKDRPYLPRLFYIRGILRHRLAYTNEQLALRLLQEAAEAEAALDSLEEHAKSVKNWSQWREGIEDFIHRQKQGQLMTKSSSAMKKDQPAAGQDQE